MVGRREQRVVTRVDRRVVDPPAVEQRTLDLPPAAVVIAPEKEEPFPRADEGEDADRWTCLAVGGQSWSGRAATRASPPVEFCHERVARAELGHQRPSGAPRDDPIAVLIE
jgi:hypothetical protein